MTTHKQNFGYAHTCHQRTAASGSDTLWRPWHENTCYFCPLVQLLLMTSTVPLNSLHHHRCHHRSTPRIPDALLNYAVRFSIEDRVVEEFLITLEAHENGAEVAGDVLRKCELVQASKHQDPALFTCSWRVIAVHACSCSWLRWWRHHDTVCLRDGLCIPISQQC